MCGLCNCRKQAGLIMLIALHLIPQCCAERFDGPGCNQGRGGIPCVEGNTCWTKRHMRARSRIARH